MVPLSIRNYLIHVSKTITDTQLDLRCAVLDNKHDPNELVRVVLINDPVRSDFVELIDMYLSTLFGNMLNKEERAAYETTVRDLFRDYYNPRCPELQKRIRKYLAKKRPVARVGKTYINETVLQSIEKKMERYISTSVLPRISLQDLDTLYDEDDPYELAEMVLWSPKYRTGFESLLEEYMFNAFPAILSISQYTDKMRCIDLFQQLYYTTKHPYLVPYLNATKTL